MEHEAENLTHLASTSAARDEVMVHSKQLTMAAQLSRPLARLLLRDPAIAPELKEHLLRLMTQRDRVPVRAALERFAAAVVMTSDPDLGLHAAQYAHPGDFEALEWVATSAATWNDACETVCRYARMLNEAAEYRIEVCADKAHVILGSTLPLRREISDFQLAAFHLTIQHWLPSVWPELAVWMRHEQPASIASYREVFPHCKLVFRAPFDGFVYDAARLHTVLPTADPVRHHQLRAQIEQLLRAVPLGDGLVARTSLDIIETMRHGNVSAERSAVRLGVSRRTLVRRLGEHGTSYSALLKEARYRTAVHYLQNSSHTVEDIAFLLGYSECAAFVRAFKRWSGSAPFAYRRLHA
jgi:AraC-like DNA-binding protein